MASLYDFVEENFGRTLSSVEYEKIATWQEDFTDDMLKYAVELAVMSNAKTFRYLEGILRNWTSSQFKPLMMLRKKKRQRAYRDTRL